MSLWIVYHKPVLCSILSSSFLWFRAGHTPIMVASYRVLRIWGHKWTGNLGDAGGGSGGPLWPTLQKQLPTAKLGMWYLQGLPPRITTAKYRLSQKILDSELFIPGYDNNDPMLWNHGNLDRLYWQQDGATVHCTDLNMRYFDSMFGDRVISRRALQGRGWPSRLPDLSPLGFFFWGFLKSKVCSS